MAIDQTKHMQVSDYRGRTGTVVDRIGVSDGNDGVPEGELVREHPAGVFNAVDSRKAGVYEQNRRVFGAATLAKVIDVASPDPADIVAYLKEKFPSDFN